VEENETPLFRQIWRLECRPPLNIHHLQLIKIGEMRTNGLIVLQKSLSAGIVQHDRKTKFTVDGI
jgi:hypothetical protein